MSDTLSMIRKCLSQQCRNEGDYYLSKPDRIFFTFKAVIAILLHLGRNGKYDRYEESYITVAILESQKTSTEWGEGVEWMELAISLKWYEWRYVIDFDGFP